MSILDLLELEQATRIQKMALQRLFQGAQRGSLVPAKTSLSSDEEADAKLALILVTMVNPWEHLTNSERALLMGINVQTLAAKEAQEMEARRNAIRSSVNIPRQFPER